MMKIAILSDIHGNLPALEAVLVALRGTVERVLFLGDLAGYYPFVNECVEAAGDSLSCGVLGNHDDLLLRSLAAGEPPPVRYTQRFGTALTRALQNLSPASLRLMQSWPLERRLELEGVSIAMFHGAPWDPLDARVYPDFQQWERFAACDEKIILLGQTHCALAREWNGKLILNPGSVGQPRDAAGGACFATLELPSRQTTLHRIAYDPSRVLADARQHDPELGYLTEVLTRR